MNVIAMWLVLVRTKLGCINILTVVAYFECAHINSTFLDHDSLPFVLNICYALATL